jgi:hypothetical protein
VEYHALREMELTSNFQQETQFLWVGCFEIPDGISYIPCSGLPAQALVIEFNLIEARIRNCKECTRISSMKMTNELLKANLKPTLLSIPERCTI